MKCKRRSKRQLQRSYRKWRAYSWLKGKGLTRTAKLLLKLCDAAAPPKRKNSCNCERMINDEWFR